jgi:hypothetical protein
VKPLLLALLAFTACARNKPYDGAPNYSEKECTDMHGAVERPPESATQADGGFQDFLDQGCMTGIFLGYAVVTSTQGAEVALCCSM